MKPENYALLKVALLYSLTLYKFIEHVMLNNIGCVLQINHKTSVQYLGNFFNTSTDGYLTEHHTVIFHFHLILRLFKLGSSISSINSLNCG